MRFTKITIIRTNKPKEITVNDLLKWFGASLGLFSLRDKDSSCFRIFIILVQDLRKEPFGLTSDELADLTGLSRGTVVYHLNRLLENGMIINAGNKYYLKVNNLEELVDEIEENLINTLNSMRTVAKHIDAQVGLK